MEDSFVYDSYSYDVSNKYRLRCRSVRPRPVGRSVHTLRQSDRQSDEIKHPTVCLTGQTKRLHDTIIGPTGRSDDHTV